MNCKEIRENLVFLIDRELPPDKEEFVRNHLQTCAACKEAFVKLEQTWLQIEQQKIRETNPDFSSGVMEKIRIAAKPQRKTVYTPGRLILQPAWRLALAGLAVIIGMVMGDSFYRSGIKSVKDSEATRFQVVADEYYLDDFSIENLETILLTSNE
jgi:anti-sigma factor RsiW